MVRFYVSTDMGIFINSGGEVHGNSDRSDFISNGYLLSLPFVLLRWVVHSGGEHPSSGGLCCGYAGQANLATTLVRHPSDPAASRRPSAQLVPQRDL